MLKSKLGDFNDSCILKRCDITIIEHRVTQLALTVCVSNADIANSNNFKCCKIKK